MRGVSFAKWNISEVIAGSLYHANISTMLVAGPDGFASIRPAPFATRRFLAMHQNIKVIMTDGHKDENSIIFPSFISWGIFLAHTIVSIKFPFSSVERKDTSFVINQITNFTQK